MSALPPAIAIGLEIADSATRLAAETGGRRWHRRLTVPPSLAEALAALQALVADVVRDASAQRASAVCVAVWGRVAAQRGVVAHLGATAAAALAEAAQRDPTGRARILYVHNGRSITSALVVNGTMLASAVALLAPEIVIIGGPLVEAGDAFLGRLRDQLNTLAAPFAPVPPLHWGTLEPFAALRGAALLAEATARTVAQEDSA